MYFITCLENLEHDILGWMDPPRCFGYFPTYERAVEALKTNECDVWEMGGIRLCRDRKNRIGHTPSFKRNELVEI